MYYNLICNFLYALLFAQNFILVKSGCYIDRLSKVAHFIRVKTTYKGSKFAELYIARIVCRHGVPKKIVSD
jgi:hypothetical protein